MQVGERPAAWEGRLVKELREVGQCVGTPDVAIVVCVQLDNERPTLHKLYERPQENLCVWLTAK